MTKNYSHDEIIRLKNKIEEIKDFETLKKIAISLNKHGVKLNLSSSGTHVFFNSAGDSCYEEIENIISKNSNNTTKVNIDLSYIDSLGGEEKSKNVLKHNTFEKKLIEKIKSNKNRFFYDQLN